MSSVASELPETPPRPGLGAAFSAPLRIFVSPGKVAREIKSGLPWWPGLLLMILVGLCLAGLLLPLQQQLMAADISGGVGNTRGLELGEGGELPAAARYGLLGGAIGGPLLGVPLMLLFVAFFYWLALTITFGGAPFGRLFTLTVYTGFVGLAYQLLNALYLRFGGVELTSMKDLQSEALMLSLGALTSGEGFLHNFLAQLGVFQIWELVVFVVGAALLMGRARRSVAVPVVVVFLMGIALAAFLATLGSRFGG